MNSENNELRLSLPVLPKPGTAVEQQIPPDVVERVSDSHVYLLWGEEIARGPAIPLVDHEGELIAYAFPYIRDSRTFPGQTRGQPGRYGH